MRRVALRRNDRERQHEIDSTPRTDARAGDRHLSKNRSRGVRRALVDCRPEYESSFSNQPLRLGPRSACEIRHLNRDRHGQPHFHVSTRMPLVPGAGA